MKTIIKSMAWSNLYSYGPDNYISFTDRSVTQLKGNNGCGKTSIPLILQEALYSKNIKGIKKDDILNRFNGAKSWWVEVIWTKGSDIYKVRSERTGDTGKVRFYCNDQDISEHKIPDTYKKIRDVLGMPFEIFSQFSYQSSKYLLDFITATDTNRKKFLISLFSLEKYLEIGETLKQAATDAESNLKLLEGEMRGVVQFLNETKIGTKQELLVIPEWDSESDLRKSLLMGELENYNKQCLRIDKNNSFIKERNNLKFNISMTQPVATQNLPETIAELEGSLAFANQEIRSIDKTLNNLNTMDTCYACGQHLDNSDALTMKNSLLTKKAEIKNKQVLDQEKLAQFKAQRTKEEQEHKAWLSNKKAIERFEELSQLIDTNIPVDYPNYETIKEEYNSIVKKLNNLKTDIENCKNKNQIIQSNNIKVDTLVEQRRNFLARQELLQDAILKNKLKISNLNILKKAFSTTGIVAYKLENLTKQLEDSINHYLEELSDGVFQLIFKLNGDKLNIVVSNRGKEAAIETVSDGQFGRIQTAILLAIRNVLSKIRGNNLNILFLDEITGVLDADGKERLLDILLKEEINTFFIAHDFEHPLVPQIHITIDSGISKIQQEK